MLRDLRGLRGESQPMPRHDVSVAALAAVHLLVLEAAMSHCGFCQADPCECPPPNDWRERIATLQQENAALLHQEALMEARTQRGITDCSTPLPVRVENIVAQLEQADKDRAQAIEIANVANRERDAELVARSAAEAHTREVYLELKDATNRAKNHEFQWRHIVTAVFALTGVEYTDPSGVIDCVRQLLADAELFREKAKQAEQGYQGACLELTDLREGLYSALGGVTESDADLIEVARLRVEAARRLATLAKEATNGWACFAKRKSEHDGIARLHREIDAALAGTEVTKP